MERRERRETFQEGSGRERKKTREGIPQHFRTRVNLVKQRRMLQRRGQLGVAGDVKKIENKTHDLGKPYHLTAIGVGFDRRRTRSLESAGKTDINVGTW